MSTPYTEWAWQQTLRPAPKLVLLAIAEEWGKYPGAPLDLSPGSHHLYAVADRTGLSPAELRPSFTELVDAGLVEREGTLVRLPLRASQ